MNAGFAEEIRRAMRGVVKENEPMARHTSFGIGGPADIWAVPQTRRDLIALLDLCESKRFPHMMIGRGSNLIVRDGGIEGLVISIDRACSGMVFHEHCVTAGAAVSLGVLARAAAEKGLKGLEFCTGIPGSVGGGLATNAGAWGSSLCEKLKSALVYDPKARATRSVPAGEVEFGYRHSNLASYGVILEAEFGLQPEDPETVSGRMREYMVRRSESQPVGFKSSGCIFKNPEGGQAGALIDALGFKGYMRGGAMVSDVHANFIVNIGGAAAADVLAVIDEIKGRARDFAGVALEEEVEVVGRE